MTDKERQELIKNLRYYPSRIGSWTLARAADEIERLTKELAAAEAVLRNTLLHYKVSDVHFLDPEEK